MTALAIALVSGAGVASMQTSPPASVDGLVSAAPLLSNHTEFDNAFYKAHTAANCKPGDANPFDVAKAAVGRYFTVVEDCTTAAKMRAAKS